MGIVKDWKDDTEGYRFRKRTIDLFSPSVWLRLRKWRKQRANRGWSDRDTWGAGDHIAKMTAEMLQYLNDKGMCDWPEWFKLNIPENEPYKDLQSVIDDINNYLEFIETSWADGLESNSNFLDPEENGPYKVLNIVWTKNGRKVSEKRINAMIDKHAKKDRELYDKAKQAMQFFGRHFSGFWD